MYYHKSLSTGRWEKLTFIEQMANIGAEVNRALSWRNKNNQENANIAFDRGLELIDLTIKAKKNQPRHKELTKMRELLIDHFQGDNIYNTSEKFWQKYFYPFNYKARLKN